MKTIKELRAFCEGVIARLDEDDLPSMDDWIMWGGYDINLAGYNHSGHARKRNHVHIEAYRDDWTNSLGEPIHIFTI